MTDNNATQTLADLLKNVDAGALLAELVKKADAKTVRELLKQVETNKPTTLSVTMDSIVAAGMSGAGMVTANVAKDVTERARACGLFKADEDATQTSVAQLIRHAGAYDAALTRAGFMPVAIASAHEAGFSIVNGKLVASEPAPEEPKAPEEPETGETAPPAGEQRTGDGAYVETPAAPVRSNKEQRRQSVTV